MNDRLGEHLWSEWDGDLYDSVVEDGIIYYTHEHVDLSNDLVRRALASSIQRDGVADSLLEAFRMIEQAVVSHGWAGYEAEDDMFMSVCDSSGETHYGDFLQTYNEVTFVEIC